MSFKYAMDDLEMVEERTGHYTNALEVGELDLATTARERLEILRYQAYSPIERTRDFTKCLYAMAIGITLTILCLTTLEIFNGRFKSNMDKQRLSKTMRTRITILH